MQTFLPYSSFETSASVLDQKRLGKQRVETLQLIKGLTILASIKTQERVEGAGSLPARSAIRRNGWLRHPASQMWRGHERALMRYQEAICAEWTEVRGFRDTCLEKTRALLDESGLSRTGSDADPPWLGDPNFHLSHQSNLVRKDRDYYGPLFPGVPGYLPYLWPRMEYEMPNRVEGQVLIENATIMFRNFAGNESEFNAKGKRNFCVVLDDPLAEKMDSEGWNVKETKPREGEVEEGSFEPRRYTQVQVSYKGRPPRIVMLSSRGRTEILEEHVSLLDSVDIAKVDLIFTPYNWELRNGTSGVNAYLRSMFITIHEDELELKYANVGNAPASSGSSEEPPF